MRRFNEEKRGLNESVVLYVIGVMVREGAEAPRDRTKDIISGGYTICLIRG